LGRPPDTWLVSIDDDVEELAAEVRWRVASGAPLQDVARWLHSGPAAGRPITCIKALKVGLGLGLAECKTVVDQVIVEVDPDYFERGLDALRREFAGALDMDESPANRDSSPS
jgi:hypothetical protein